MESLIMLKKESPCPGKRATGATVRHEDDPREEFLQFERLITDLSARFVNILPDQVDQQIERALGQLLEFFQVDRCGLLGLSPDLNHVHVTHAAYSDDTWSVSGDIDLAEIFPWTYEQLVFQRRPVRINTLAELPEDAGKDRASYIAMHIRCLLDIPLIFEGRVSALIVINSTRNERTWPEEYVPRLQLLGEILINALERKKAEQKLRESEIRLSLTADAAGAMLWNLDAASGQIWTSEKTREFFGFAPHSDMNLESFLGVVHPEDREKLRRITEETIRSGGENSFEYRIVQPDGSIRWVYTKGLMQSESHVATAGLIGVSLDITRRKQDEENLRKSYKEIFNLKSRLEEENFYLKSKINEPLTAKAIIGRSDAIQYVQYRVSQVSSMDTTVLILGETGTGKGLVARAVHEASRRKDRPLIHVNCAVLPANLIESELFGREKGAYTGAQSKQIGRFQLADKGTIILDEIAELPVELQAKLLRILEQGEFERLGNPRTINTDVRIIASTNRNLEEEIAKGRFREDLFYRLNVFPITVPPLRERVEDIPLIVDALIERLNKELGRHVSRVPQDVMHRLQSYRWPGNVRELENIIERAVIMSRGTELQLAEQLGFGLSHTAEMRNTTPVCLEDMERCHILKTLEALKWKIGGPAGAAQALGLKPSTLRSRMQKLHIHRPEIS